MNSTPTFTIDDPQALQSAIDKAHQIGSMSIHGLSTDQQDYEKDIKFPITLNGAPARGFISAVTTVVDSRSYYVTAAVLENDIEDGQAYHVTITRKKTGWSVALDRVEQVS